ncbi:MAG: ATP-binding protein [Patulibacter sp.]
MPAIPRKIAQRVVDALDDTRVVVILGPRQAGKTTLVRSLAPTHGARTYVTLDDHPTRTLAQSDPDGFIANLALPVAIDEVQRAPSILLSIKARVDRAPDPGAFLLTGSANLLASGVVADALPGRAEYIRLWPFAQGELSGQQTTLIDRLVDGEPPRLTEQPIGLAAYAELVVRGGFPDVQARSASRRVDYFASYLATRLGIDLADVAGDRVSAATARRLFRLLAARSGELANYANLASAAQISAPTARRYVELLEELFLVQVARPWGANLGNREIRSPKLLVSDSGLLAATVGADAARIASDGGLAGRLVETFAYNEVVRLCGWSAVRVAEVGFFRDRDGREVDIVVELLDGRIIAFEVKAAATLGRSDGRGLRYLRDRLGERFVAGAVLHAGATTLPISDRIWALPLSALWS